MLVFRSLATAALAVGILTVASAQMWNQPWTITTPAGTGPGSIESRVWDCYPTHVPKIAVVDDFVANGRPVKRVVWWGSVVSRDQPLKPYLIGFYKTNPTGNCAPDLNRFIFQCVVPKATIVGIDCKGTKVWRFAAYLSFWFIGAVGERYWIQISEQDEKSVHPEIADFFWSFHKRTPNYPNSWNSCKALAFNNGLTLFNIVDPCDNDTVDMAFQLWG